MIIKIQNLISAFQCKINSLPSFPMLSNGAWKAGWKAGFINKIKYLLTTLSKTYFFGYQKSLLKSIVYQLSKFATPYGGVCAAGKQPRYTPRGVGSAQKLKS